MLCALGLFALGVGYFLLVHFTPFSVPCMFHEITGLLCPGCGITRFCVCLVLGDFAGAWAAHPALFFLGPPLLFCLLLHAICYVKTGVMASSKALTRFEFLLACAFLLFGIWRNIPSLL